MVRRVYLDHSATTPLHPEVLEAMKPYMLTHFGNASSAHFFGEEAKEGMEKARCSVAEVLSCSPEEVIFTSGGTESDNLLLKGVGFAKKNKGDGNHLITLTIEHHAISHTCTWLAKNGFDITEVNVGFSGIVDPEDICRKLRSGTIIVSVMYANNETGCIQPIAEISQAVKKFNPGIVVHTDAVQTPGHLPLDVKMLGVDALSLSAHKFYGPKGIGILYLKKGVPLEPRILGGGHESSRRAGTSNVPGMVGLAAALKRAEARRERSSEKIAELRDHLVRRVFSEIFGSQLNGDHEMRLPGNANLSFSGIDGSSLLTDLSRDGIAVSTGSACSSGDPVSFVLKAMGVSPRFIGGSLRITLGENTTQDEIDYCVEALKKSVSRLRQMSPL